MQVWDRVLVVRMNTGADPAKAAELETLVDEWLTLGDVAERLHVSIGEVRRMVEDRELVAVRRGHPKVPSVPAILLDPRPLPGLAGTVTVLNDAGYDDVEALVWLFTAVEDLGGTPVAALRGGRKTEIRRRAMLLAF